jgi:anti-anti-sigma factor
MGEPAQSKTTRIVATQPTAVVYELKLSGELGRSAIEGLDKAIREAFSRKVFRIALDMEGVSYISSTVITLLIDFTRSARKNGGDILLAGMPEKLTHIFHLLGMSGDLAFAKNREEALQVLNRGIRIW